MHTPVLLQEVMRELDVKSGAKYIDATFGEGGHTSAILSQGGNVLAFEWDKKNFEAKIKDEKFKNEKLLLVNENFADIKKVSLANNFKKVDGILFDLGLSMEQIRKSEKGFSYKQPNELLDMRIGSDLSLTASEILETYEESKLKQMLIKNSEEIRSEQIAKKIVSFRRERNVKKVEDLLMIINSISNNHFEREAVLRRVFQALRIEVNREYENLEKGIKDGAQLLISGGKMLIITFHPSEDRYVKRYLSELKSSFEIKKIIMTKSDNAFERSAKLRVAIKN
ncbi:MAG TPA: 16S rRNA (cytosine(1402)-N(4))-methyltransferase RsmH [Candidatus Nitrosocosmicus sp.]|nr:16S rRNA (cytosine(1402)-N(4))-methyltransferase RsmH [Candidatus Nitrosocosmicus sp.]